MGIFLRKVGRKFLSYLVTEIRFMFSSKGTDTGITVPRPVEVCFSEKTLTVTDSS